VRDIDAALREVFDEQVVSKSTVSRICEGSRERYRRWCRRRSDEHDVVYLFLDVLYLKLHPDDAPSEGVLVCWGVTLQERKVLLGLALGSRESYEDWLSFGRDLMARGMRAPALVFADGHPGSGRRCASSGPPRLSSAAPSTRSGTCLQSYASATTARSRPAGGGSSTRHAPPERHASSCRHSSMVLPGKWDVTQTFDAVISDPPYFDNIDYERESRPHFNRLTAHDRRH
jgi:hypothetical protein